MIAGQITASARRPGIIILAGGHLRRVMSHKGASPWYGQAEEDFAWQS